MTYSLSKPSSTIISQGAKILSTNNLTPTSPRAEKASAVFRFVRDEIKFGFTRRFDNATPEETLKLRRGHCNPQSALFASLLNSVGIKSAQKFVVLSPAVLHGVLPAPARLVHSCVVVETGDNGEKCDVDGFIVGKDVFEGAKRRLEREGRIAGYGIAVDGSCEWEGFGDCLVQMTNGVGEVLGVFDEPCRFLDSDRNFQKLGIRERGLLGLSVGWINRGIDRIGEL